MRQTTVIVIGAGQAGLAMSRCLTARAINHAVLERGQIGERWRTSSWQSLRLLTPNWMTRLPGFRYDGPEPDGFMTAAEVIQLLERYAVASQAPVETDTLVQTVEADGEGFRVVTNRGDWQANAVVIATGYCDVPAVPAARRTLASSIHQLVPGDYRHPAALPAGGVLVVGASATGVQLADELRRSGREVTLSVGRHTRLPRCYRGRDILWWLDRLGVLAARVDAVHNIAMSRDKPSMQLVGRSDCESLDLAVLHARGVRLAGRLRRAHEHRVRFDDDLIATTAAADVKLAEIRARIDDFAATHRIPCEPPDPFTPTWPVAASALTEIDLKNEGIETVIWATGYRRAYPWLRLPVLDAWGEIVHQEGVTSHPRLYVLGLNFQRQRNSSFIDGVGTDAVFIARHLSQALVPVGAGEAGQAGGEMLVVAAQAASPSPARSSEPTRPTKPTGPTRPAYDAIIVGGRCAGAATALLLARDGARVLVMERGAYGTDTLSTHALMRGGVFQLHRWGVLRAIVEAGTPAIRSTTFGYRGSAISVAIEPRFGVEALYAPRRALLDRLLVDAATRAGAEFMYRTTAQDVVRDAVGRVVGLVSSTDGVLRRFDASLVIGADGLRSTIATRVGAPCVLRGEHATAVLYSYVEGLHLRGYEWHYRDGLSLGVIPTNDRAACVFVSIPSHAFQREVHDDATTAYGRLIRRLPDEVSSRIVTARRVEPVRGFIGHPGCVKRCIGPGWALVGDAGYYMDPLTAHGITNALRDAELLARAILRGQDEALAEYEKTRDDLSHGLFKVTDQIASFQWNEDELQALHRALSREMSREVTALAELEPLPCPLLSVSAPRAV